MNVAGTMDSPDKSKYPIKNVGGVDFVDPLNDERYLVKYYELPPKEDLKAYIKLIESFERRFLNTVDRGYELKHHKRDIDEYIEAKRRDYQTLDGGEKDLAGGQLCVALLDRGVENAKQHIRLRMNGTSPDDPKLKELYEQAGKDLTEGVKYFQHVRRKRGHRDIDDVVNEMKGEPYNIFIGTLEHSGSITFWHKNRFLKAAKAMKCIDSISDTMAVLGTDPAIKTTFLPLLDALAQNAKERLQLQRQDPAFEYADMQLLTSRNAIHDLLSKKDDLALSFPVVMKNHLSREAKDLIEDTVDLVYDIAVVRNERLKSAAILKERVSDYVRAKNAVPPAPAL